MTRPSLAYLRSRSGLAAASVVHIAAAAMLLPVLASGCDHDRHIGWERQRQIVGPVPLETSIAYVDSARDRAVIVPVATDLVSNGEADVRTVAIGRRAVFATTTPDRRRLAVITRGEEALRVGQIDQEPHLWLIDVPKGGLDDSDGAGPTAYPIGSPFDRLAISSDGNTAVAYFSDRGPDAEGFFRNPNELAIIDLSRPPSDDNPTMVTIRSFGAVPDGVVLSPPISIPGSADPTPRTFAFVLAPENLTIIDTSHPERRDIAVRLDVTGEAVRPRQLVFAPRSATVYVRSDNARDILELVLTDDPLSSSDARDNDFRPILAELGAGAGPGDIAVYDDIDDRRLILAATPGTGELVVIDSETAAFKRIPTPDPIDRVLLFPTGAGVTPRLALLASIGARRARLHLLRLDRITDDLTRPDLTEIPVSEPVLDVVPVPGRELAMLVHDDERTVLGLLDVVFGSVSPLEGVGRLDAYAFSSDGEFLIGATDGVDRIGLLELSNLHPGDIRLDDQPVRLFSMPGGAIYVDHGDPFGRATIIPSPRAARSESVVLTGFLLADLFDQEF